MADEKSPAPPAEPPNEPAKEGPSADSTAVPSPVGPGKSVRMLLMAVMTLLLLELVLGLLTNALVSKLPSSPAGFFTGVGSDDYAVAVGHIVIGYLLGLLGLVLIYFLYKAQERRALIGSVLALVFVGIAGAAGMEFVSTDGAGAWSGLMAISFVISFVLYLWVERATRPAKKTPA